MPDRRRKQYHHCKSCNETLTLAKEGLQKTVQSHVRFLFLTNLKQPCLHQNSHAEELTKVNNKLQAAQELNRTSEEKQEALEHELHTTEDEMNNLTRQLENMKNEVVRKQGQLQKELDERGL